MSATAPLTPGHFHGGIHMPDHKAESTTQPVAAVKIPPRLVLPLQQHIGAPAKAMVSVGEHVLKGQLIAAASGRVSAPIHAPTSGVIAEISDHLVPHSSGLSASCITIDTDGRDEWAELPPPIDDFASTDKAVLIERIREAGIVGLGGATFPSSIKMEARNNSIDTLIINAAECEPYITCDDMLMREQAEQIVSGIHIIRHILGVKRCLIGIEDNKPEAIKSMRAAVAAASLQNTGVVSVPTLYPSGGERQLTLLLTGKEVPSHGIPANIGIVCHNVGTVYAIADAVLKGRPLISRIVTLTGEGVAQPQNVYSLIGTSAGELIAQAGGYTEKANQLICGGPMMGFSMPTDEVPVTKAVNCLLVASEQDCPPPEPATACIRCGKCAEACPAQLLPQQLYWHSRSRNFDKAQDYHLFDCIECGCCSHVCPSHIQLVHYYRFAKTQIWSKEKEKSKADHARQRHEARVARLERIAAERKARMRKKKAALKSKKGGGESAKKAAIAAAVKRAAAKKSAAKAATNSTQGATE
ncbi:MAG: electron transport complex subunit RsxC [Pseudomonadota bacterium]|nr:electron transport complex subunit RsxC [Pseudomonadota bacterium]